MRIAHACACTAYECGQGLDWIAATKLFLGGKDVPAYFAALYLALEKFYDSYDLMCLSHGDCRPGNMLFDPKSAKEAGR